MSQTVISDFYFIDGKPQWELSSKDQLPAGQVFFYNEQEKKKVDRLDQVVNADLSLHAILSDGKEIALFADESLYSTLKSTWFDPVKNLHYFAKRGEKGQFLLGVWKTGSSRIVKGGYFLQEVEVKKDILSFTASDRNLNPMDAALVLWSKKFKEIIEFPLSEKLISEGKFDLDIHEIKEKIAIEGVRWDLLLRFRSADEKIHFLRFEKSSNRHRMRRGNAFQFRFPKKENYNKEQTDRFLPGIPVDLQSNNESMMISPNYTIDGQLSLQGILQSRYYMRTFTEELLDLSLTDERMEVTIRCKDRGFDIKGLSIVLREDLSVRHPFTLISEKKTSKGLIQTYECRIQDIEWQSISYNFVVEEEKDGIVYDIRPKNTSYWFRRRFYQIKWQNSVDMDDFILILMTMKNGNVLLRYRERLEFDDISYRKRERKARILYLLGKPVLDHMGIILLFERFSTAAQDNGVHMFEYYREQGYKHAYYVIRTDMPDYHKVEQYKDHVIPFMSLKHMVYIQAAKVLVSTDTKRHGYQWLGPNSRVYNKLLKKPVVFLQHGVLAMKQVSSIYDRYRANAADLFITSSEMEKRIVNQYFRYEQNRIAVTGLARWDVLFDHSKEQKVKEILFIPTWRGWMDGILKEDFLKSEYYQVYKHLLESKKLDELLQKHNMHMIFCMHHKFREFVGEFPEVSENIKLFDFGDTPVNELIMRCSFLVTDYSSVAWDTYYLEKPCIFYQFDYNQYMELQGSYIDMEKELFGTRVTTEDDLLVEMEQCMDSGFKEKEEFALLRKEYLPYRDRKHRARIAKAINEKKFNGKTEVL